MKVVPLSSADPVLRLSGGSNTDSAVDPLDLMHRLTWLSESLEPYILQLVLGSYVGSPVLSRFFDRREKRSDMMRGNMS